MASNFQRSSSFICNKKFRISIIMVGILFNIPVNLEERGLFQMVVWDILGSRICKLEPRMLDAGLQIIEWDGRNDDGEYVASGTYFYRIWSSRSRSEGRLTLIR